MAGWIRRSSTTDIHHASIYLQTSSPQRAPRAPRVTCSWLLNSEGSCVVIIKVRAGPYRSFSRLNVGFSSGHNPLDQDIHGFNFAELCLMEDGCRMSNRPDPGRWVSFKAAPLYPRDVSEAGSAKRHSSPNSVFPIYEYYLRPPDLILDTSTEPLNDPKFKQRYPWPSTESCLLPRV